MVTIQNKSFNKKFTEQTKVKNYADLLQAVLNTTPQEGWKMPDMKKALAIISKLEKPIKEIKLEDAEHDFVKTKMEGYSWAILDKDIVDFHDSIMNVK